MGVGLEPHGAGPSPGPHWRRYEGKFKADLLQTWAAAKSLPLVIRFGAPAHMKALQKAYQVGGPPLGGRLFLRAASSTLGAAAGTGRRRGNRAGRCRVVHLLSPLCQQASARERQRQRCIGRAALHVAALALATGAHQPADSVFMLTPAASLPRACRAPCPAWW